VCSRSRSHAPAGGSKATPRPTLTSCACNTSSSALRHAHGVRGRAARDSGHLRHIFLARVHPLRAMHRRVGPRTLSAGVMTRRTISDLAPRHLDAAAHQRTGAKQVAT
jgi:hypothetical protein